VTNGSLSNYVGGPLREAASPYLSKGQLVFVTMTEAAHRGIQKEGRNDRGLAAGQVGRVGVRRLTGQKQRQEERRGFDD
jgi:hypothetical protein